MSSAFDCCAPANLLREDARRLRHFGVVQIMLGLINLGFGVPLYYSAPYVIAIGMWIPWWTGILFVISGSLTMLYVDAPERGLKKATVIFNFVSVAAAAVGAGIYVISCLMSRAGSSVWVSRTPMYILALLFLYSVVEIFMSLLVAIILWKHM
ncbi:membrane-spanning 4-domains subfamily A member 12-like [Heptranchias perlo]|uniref:membrane-spanning 4-domains subfamily A member 12-like n=1 Tax=Heptranchias perlo TaxID=212740 RepID=UPI00355A6137